MLEADYLWDVPDSVVAIWEELEDWAIEDIIYRIVRMDELNQAGIGGAAVYRMELLQRMGMDMNNVMAEISKYTKKSEKELKELFLDAGARTLENDSKVLLEHGIKTAMLNSNEWAKQILQMMYNKTNGELRNFTGTFAQNYQRIVHECFDKAFVETATGMRSYTEAVGQAIDDLGKMGITMVNYKNNRKDTVETAVRRAVLTGINQAAMQISVENCKKLGVEYVIVSSHLGARVSEDKVANHAGWQGKVFKIEGSDEIALNLLEETGFPKNPLGLGGYNCRHNMFPYFPGDENPYKQFGKEENEKAYRISQEQRAKERAIRKRKRQLMALQKGIEATDNEKLKFDLQQRYDKTAHKLQLQNKNYHDFCEEHKVKTQTERMKTAKWDRAQARMAGAGAQRYRNGLLVDENDLTQGIKKKYNKFIDELTDFKKPKKYADLPEELRVELEEIVAEAPELLKRQYDKSKDRLKFINFNAKVSSRTSGGIRLNITQLAINSEEDKHRAYFHEVGHEVDCMLGRVSHKLDFGEKIKNDFDNILDAVADDRKIDKDAVLEVLKEEFQSDRFHSVKDIINGIYKENIFPSSNHNKKYWNGSFKLEHEAFAHMFEATIRNDFVKIHYLKSMFPSAYEEFLRMLEEGKDVT